MRLARPRCNAIFWTAFLNTLEGTGFKPRREPPAAIVVAAMLTAGQRAFVERLAQNTGLDPDVLSAWVAAEMQGDAARARDAAGHHNWLNIGYLDAGPLELAFDRAFSDPVGGADRTTDFLAGAWGGPSRSIRAILGTAQRPVTAQLRAIYASNWASTHYGHGNDLVRIYNAIRGDTLTVGATRARHGDLVYAAAGAVAVAAWALWPGPWRRVVAGRVLRR